MSDRRESEYLEWARSHGNIKYSLALSGVPPIEVSLLSPTVDDFTMVADNEYGWAPLLERIASRYAVEPENVVLAHGTSMANHLACASLAEPGDHVVIEWPVYDPLVAVPRYLDCEVSLRSPPIFLIGSGFLSTPTTPLAASPTPSTSPLSPGRSRPALGS